MLKIIKRIFELTFDLIKGKEYPRFTLAEVICRIIYPKYKFSEFGMIYLEDEKFLDWYKRYVSKYNFHSLDRKYTLNELIKLTLDVEGDTVECGAFQGASSYLICENIKHTEKQHHIFDSFEGLCEPEPKDGSWWKKGAFDTSDEIIKSNLNCFDNVHYYKSWIPTRFSEVENLSFSFVHIDVDLYQATKDSVDFFYEKISNGGIFLFDDYGFNTCPGAKLAIDEFFHDKQEKIILLPTGQSFVIKK
ncbi:MAG: TylF/MycF/NovP-related O-methyltransferase [Candidatus Marithrix sp.]